MELIKGHSYTYTNTVRVGIHCKRMKRQLNVVYVGSDVNNEVFQTKTGTELLIHKDDVKERIKCVVGTKI